MSALVFLLAGAAGFALAGLAALVWAARTDQFGDPGLPLALLPCATLPEKYIAALTWIRSEPACQRHAPSIGGGVHVPVSDRPAISAKS
jgi:hypothetical protein